MKFKLAVSMFVAVFAFSGVQALAINYPSGEIICASDGTKSCYEMYSPPGGSPSKKYIGNADTLGYYTQAGYSSGVATTSSANLSSYPTYNWNLDSQCGSVVKDAGSGKIYIMQPIAADGDFGSGTFSYSNVFPLYVQSLSTSSLQAVVQPAHIRTVSSVSNVLGNTVEGYYLPACTIVQEQGTGDFYRLTGYVTTQGMQSIKKSYIGSPELLALWLKQTGFYIPNQVVSGYPDAASASLPPGLLVKSDYSSNIYFSNDNGTKYHIASMQDLNSLGFTQANILTVSQTIIDSAITVSDFTP